MRRRLTVLLSIAVVLGSFSPLSRADDDARPPHAKKARITHHPGSNVEFRASDGTRYQLRLIVQPMLRFTDVSTLPDDAVDLILRRARIGLEARLAHHIRVRFELQLKNMRFGLSNLWGAIDLADHLRLTAGFFKAPGGLERDTYTFAGPFIERSFQSFFTYDREVGVKLAGEIPARALFWAASITRDPPEGVDGGDPEDKPIIPPGVEADDVIRGPSKWNTAGRLGFAPGHEFEASVTANARFRTDLAEPDFGDRLAEPYDSGVVDARPYYGVMIHAGADTAITIPHFRAMLEGGVRRDGTQLHFDPVTGARTALSGHLDAEMGYLVLGWSPRGHYGDAVDNAPLLDGWEIVARFEGGRVKPVDIGQVLFVSANVGFHWEVTPSLRVQADVAFETFNANAEDNNTGARRWIGQLWANWRI